MRKVVLMISIIWIVVMLSSCGELAEPIENPNIDEFEELYVGDDYSILVRSEIDPDMLYTMEAYGFGYGDNVCNVGSYHRINYMFYYKENYYDIVEFNKLRMISCDDLREIGIIN
jgi:hypothetical protein